jgi:hypothetical protein
VHLAAVAFRGVDWVALSAAGRQPPVEFAAFFKRKPDASAFRQMKPTARFFTTGNTADTVVYVISSLMTFAGSTPVSR